jgi:hypothetical protein
MQNHLWLTRIPQKCFSIATNFAGGAVPSELRVIEGLVVFDVSANQISGQLPSKWQCGLTLRYNAQLFGNAITGTIPRNPGGMEALENLWVNTGLWPTRMTYRVVALN